MGKVLPTEYHTQRNNKILPFVTCGTTCLANYLGYLAEKAGKAYVHDDDKVFQFLNSPQMLTKAKEMIKKGIIDESALCFRTDNPNTPQIDESKFSHLNNFMEMLAVCGNDLTEGDYQFKIEYKKADEIKNTIDSGYPALVSAKFTSGGHFVLVVGYDDASNWVVDDPYGNWNNGYKKADESGAKLKYSIDKVAAVYTFKKGDKLRTLTAQPTV